MSTPLLEAYCETQDLYDDAPNLDVPPHDEPRLRVLVHLARSDVGDSLQRLARAAYLLGRSSITRTRR